MAKYTPAQREAAARYDAKTYQKIGVALRFDEDKDIIDSWKRARAKGITSREWLRELFDNQK